MLTRQISWLQLIILAQRTGARHVLPRPYDLRDLTDMPEIVKRPLMQHVRQRDLARRAMQRHPRAGLVGLRAQEFDVRYTLVFEMIERLVGIGIAVEI